MGLIPYWSLVAKNTVAVPYIRPAGTVHSLKSSFWRKKKPLDEGAGKKQKLLGNAIARGAVLLSQR